MKFSPLPLALPFLAGACEDPLKHAQRLEEPRILGVRMVSASGEASLTPGAGATVELLAAGPTGPFDGRLAYELCEAVASDRGVPSCAEAAFAGGVTTLSDPIAVDIPAELDGGARLAFLGAACTTGEPALGHAPLDWSCSGGEEPLRLSFDAQTRTAGSSNRNPDLSELRFEIAGVEGPLDDPRSPPSCPGSTEVASGRTHRVVWRLGPGAREVPDGAETARSESLQLSHFSNTGHFERSLSFIDGATEPNVALEWDAPAAGVAAKLYLVVRDGRGGVSWVSTSVCAR